MSVYSPPAPSPAAEHRDDSVGRARKLTAGTDMGAGGPYRA